MPTSVRLRRMPSRVTQPLHPSPRFMKLRIASTLLSSLAGASSISQVQQLLFVTLSVSLPWPWLRRRSSLAIIGLALITVAGIAVVGPLRHQAFRGSCVPANRVDQVGLRIYDNHRTVTVSPGTIVTVQLWTGAGINYWPWETPRSNDESVLAPLPLC